MLRNFTIANQYKIMTFNFYKYFSRKRITMVAMAFLFTVCASAHYFPFQWGEKLTFTIHYKWGFSADVGTAAFELRESEYNNVPAYHIFADAKSNGFFDGIYKVRDTYESKFAMDDLRPLWFHRTAEEGNKYTAENEMICSDGGKTIHTKVVKSTRPPVDTIAHTEEVTRDLMNFYYYLRTMDLEKLEQNGEQYFLGLLDRNIIMVGVRVLRHEQKKISGIGKFNTVVVGFRMKSYKLDQVQDDGRFSIADSVGGEKDSIIMWLTEDENHRPVLFSAPVTIGSINGRLSAYEGLKYPLNSLTTK